MFYFFNFEIAKFYSSLNHKNYNLNFYYILNHKQIIHHISIKFIPILFVFKESLSFFSIPFKTSFRSWPFWWIFNRFIMNSFVIVTLTIISSSKCFIIFISLISSLRSLLVKISHSWWFPSLHWLIRIFKIVIELSS